MAGGDDFTKALLQSAALGTGATALAGAADSLVGETNMFNSGEGPLNILLASLPLATGGSTAAAISTGTTNPLADPVVQEFLDRGTAEEKLMIINRLMKEDTFHALDLDQQTTLRQLRRQAIEDIASGATPYTDIEYVREQAERGYNKADADKAAAGVPNEKPLSREDFIKGRFRRGAGLVAGATALGAIPAVMLMKDDDPNMAQYVDQARQVSRNMN